MNLVIILSEAMVLNSFKKFLKKFIASIIASLFYIGTLFYSEISFLQIFISLIIIKISFNPSNIKVLIKETILFYFISFLFGGISFAMVNVFNNGKITILDGVLIADFSLLKIILCGILGAFLVITFLKKKNKHVLKDMMISYKEKEICLKVLLDTGNLLKEPYTNKPVIIVEKEVLKDILPKEIINNFQEIVKRKKRID